MSSSGIAETTAEPMATAGASSRSRFKGRAILVTGAGATDGVGIGAASAILYAREGANVVVLDRDADAAEGTTRLIREEHGVGVGVRADVTDEADVAAAVAACAEAFGRIDVLQNTVGVLRPGGIADTSLSDLLSLYEINVGGALLASQQVIPRMQAAGGGVIVNVSSIGSHRTTGNGALAYSTSKAALEQLTRLTARQGAAIGVRCNAVVPGSIDTPAARRSVRDDEEYRQLNVQRSSAVPMGRLGDAWEVAEVCLFLASEQSRYVTGALVPVDGGLSLA